MLRRRRSDFRIEINWKGRSELLQPGRTSTCKEPHFCPLWRLIWRHPMLERSSVIEAGAPQSASALRDCEANQEAQFVLEMGGHLQNVGRDQFLP